VSRLRKEPRLRTADKIPPPYPLNDFPKQFGLEVGRQVIYILATKPTPSLEGEEWEEIFAHAIGAEWKPSNVGLDDIVLDNCAWGAKTVYNSRPWTCTNVRLISGRNSPVFSYGGTVSTDHDPVEVGRQVVDIWNARVDSVRAKYKHVRTVVLIKSPDLLKLSVFEFETIRYAPELYDWTWNNRGNLEGHRDGKHYFTWQPHGSQFTIKEYPPKQRLCIELKPPGKIPQDTLLRAIGFDESWVKIHTKEQT
jgi:hypothetical protein